MNILHISASDGGGGAARAAYRLHEGLLRGGHDCRMLVHRRVTCDPAVMTFTTGWSFPRRAMGALRAGRIGLAVRRHYGTRPAGLGPFTGDRSRFGADFGRLVPACDIAHLHWTGDDYLDYQGFFDCFPERAPVVWTLHDMNVFTGGCHYDEGCGRYLSGCGRCPQLGSKRTNDLSARIYRRKKTLFDRLPADGSFRVVTASKWMGRLASASPLLSKFEVSVIPYGLDADCFQPCRSATVRRTLGIGEREKMVLFVAENLNARRKGMRPLIEALGHVRRTLPYVRLVCVGAMCRLPPYLDLPLINLGSVNDDRLLALIYSAADVFVIPSLEEAFGLTALEAMACGTPVVGFDTGGIPDMVRPGHTGLLASVGDAVKLAEAVSAILQDPELRFRMELECRNTVLAEYTLAHQAESYRKLYGEMVE